MIVEKTDILCNGRIIKYLSAHSLNGNTEHRQEMSAHKHSDTYTETHVQIKKNMHRHTLKPKPQRNWANEWKRQKEIACEGTHKRKRAKSERRRERERVRDRGGTKGKSTFSNKMQKICFSEQLDVDVAVNFQWQYTINVDSKTEILCNSNRYVCRYKAKFTAFRFCVFVSVWYAHDWCLL